MESTEVFPSQLEPFLQTTGLACSVKNDSHKQWLQGGATLGVAHSRR